MAMDLDARPNHSLGPLPKPPRLPDSLFHVSFIDLPVAGLRPRTANAYGGCALAQLVFVSGPDSALLETALLARAAREA